MTGWLDTLFDVDPVLVYVLVTVLVFVEDAVFVGFVLPAETAVLIGGVIADQGRVDVVILGALVVTAAIVGDSVGYEIGRRFGPRLLAMAILRRRGRIDRARDLLRRRGGGAVFIGRFVAFFRAVMPALAGLSHMRYGKFLLYNALGGIVWGAGVVALGYYGAGSYRRVESDLGTATMIVVAVVVITGIGWRVHAHRRRSAGGRGRRDRYPSDGKTGDPDPGAS